MDMSAILRSSVERAFALLGETYGLRLLRDRADSAGSEVVLGNSKAAVRIRLEPREGLFVSLLRLHNGLVPSRDLDDRMRDPFNGFDLDDLIQLRSPQLHIPSASPVTTAGLSESLDAYALFLQEHAGDVLSGDFGVFTALAQRVAGRIRAFESEGHSIGPDSKSFLAAAERIEGSERRTE